MNDPLIAELDRLIDDGRYQPAFALAYAIATDNGKCPPARAEAFAVMGQLVRINPGFSPSDPTGLNYFVSALDLDLDCYSAHIGVAGTIGSHYPDHRNVPLAARSIQWLQSHTSCVQPHDV